MDVPTLSMFLRPMLFVPSRFAITVGLILSHESIFFTYLCVISEFESVDESSSDSDDVLERAAHLDRDGVVDDRHAEVGSLNQKLQRRTRNLGNKLKTLIRDYSKMMSHKLWDLCN